MSSSRTADRLSRILGMLPWVMAHPGARVTEVCERFGYTRAELARDLNLVFVCGLPGYGPGDLMVAYIDGDEVVVDLADYFARPVRLTPAEALLLLASGMAMMSTGEAPEALISGVAKLQAALLPEGEPLAVDLPAPPALVPMLGDAAAAGRVVEIVYTSLATGETTRREVEPWRVFAALGNWYLMGRCRLAEGERIFRVDRIREAALTGEGFILPAALPPAEVRFMPRAEDVQAVIRLGPAAGWVAEYYPVEIVAQDDARTVVRFAASDPAVGARLLVRLGRDAELLEGAEVAAAAADLRFRIKRRYAAE
ncbi:MAG TPA: WYL domain-containing protein [Acidimicrobiia bacterium]|nr:WYL domain-containing protein [Acidimicrobiia bacterium]